MHVSVVPLILLWSSTLVHIRQYTWYMHVTVIHCTRTHSTIQTRHKKHKKKTRICTYTLARTSHTHTDTDTHTHTIPHVYTHCLSYHWHTDHDTRVSHLAHNTMQYSNTLLILKNKIQQDRWYQSRARTHTSKRARTNTHTHTRTHAHTHTHTHTRTPVSYTHLTLPTMAVV